MSWLQTPGAATLARTLLHSLWEGAAVALALAVFLCFARSARVRYAAACVAMVVLLSGLVATFARLAPAPSVPVRLAWDSGIAGVSGAVQQAGGVRPSAPARDSQLADYMVWAVPLWAAGVFLFYLRGIAGWMAARRLRRIGVCSAPELWRARMDRLRSRLRLSKSVVLMESSLAEVPVVMGYLRPMILMPVGMLAGMPVAQVEAILLHELAHIRRYDYVVNLLQVFVEGLLFYHPGVWWISGVMRTEREYCCDDVVVAATGGALDYATALTALERRRVNGAVLAATGGRLVRRIERVLGRPRNRSVAAIPVLAAALLTVTAVTAMMAFETRPAARAIPIAPPVMALAPIPEALTLPLLAQAAPAPPVMAAPQSTTGKERGEFVEQFWLQRDPAGAGDTAVPTTTAVQPPASSLPDRKISPNDLISISVLNEPEVSKPSIRVGADGAVEVPLLASRLHVAGLLPREAEAEIARQLIGQQLLVHPLVTVSILEYATRHISVVGDVKTPGQFDITGPITLMEAMAKAGWTTADAGPELLFSKAASDTPRKINIQELQNGDETVNVTLTGGEVISVPDAPKVWVMGNVPHTGSFPLGDPAKRTVLNVVGRVDGVEKSYNKTAYIYRADSTGKRQEIEVPLREIMQHKVPDVALLPGDILLIPDANGADRRRMLENQPKVMDAPPPAPPILAPGGTGK